MSARLVVVSVLAGLLGASTAARADYYFTTLEGTQEGPYSSYEQCQEARNTNRAWVNANLCVEIGGGMSSPPAHAGLGRFWGAAVLAGVSSGKRVGADGWAGGMELARGAYPGRHFYMFANIFGMSGDVTGSDGKSTGMGAFGLILGPEFMSGTGRLAAFVQLGGGLVLASAGNAEDYFGVQGAAGLEVSLSPSTGLLVYGMGIATPNLPGTVLAGIALEHRSAYLLAVRGQ